MDSMERFLNIYKRLMSEHKDNQVLIHDNEFDIYYWANENPQMIGHDEIEMKLFESWFDCLKNHYFSTQPFIVARIY